MNKFNPKVEDFIKANPNKTLVGMAWSMYWRLWLVMIAIYLAAGIAMAFFNWLSEQ
jgi:hypothetical protein